MSEPDAPPVIRPRRAWLPWALAFGCGIAGWLIASWVAGTREAWDSPVYGKGAYPIFALVCGGFGYWQINHPWRWPLAIAGGQALALFVSGPIGNLAPLGAVAMLAIAAPLLIPAVLGAKLRAWCDGE